MRVDCETWSPQKELVSCETRHFISSIDPSTVTDEDLNRLVRGHWQVENCLHLVKDRWWDEDKHYLKRPGLGVVFAMLTNAALSVLQLLRKKCENQKSKRKQWEPLTQTAENFRYCPRKALKMIGVKKN